MIQRAKEEIALLSCANLRAGMGKFWASDSDSDCEDLGDAEMLASGSHKVAAADAFSDGPGQKKFQQAASLSSTTPSSRQSRPGSQSATPSSQRSRPGSQPATFQHAVPPWKKLWKGPLPPRRVSPAKTLGDVVLPALAAAGGRKESRAGGDPVFQSIPVSKTPRHTRSESKSK